MEELTITLPSPRWQQIIDAVQRDAVALAEEIARQAKSQPAPPQENTDDPDDS